MPIPEEPTNAVEKLRENIAALLKRSADKFEEMKGIQTRIDRLAAEFAKATDASDAEKQRSGCSEGTAKACDS